MTSRLDRLRDAHDQSARTEITDAKVWLDDLAALLEVAEAAQRHQKERHACLAWRDLEAALAGLGEEETTSREKVSV